MKTLGCCLCADRPVLVKVRFHGGFAWTFASGARPVCPVCRHVRRGLVTSTSTTEVGL